MPATTDSTGCTDVDTPSPDSHNTSEANQPPIRVLLAVHVKGAADADDLPTFISGDETEQADGALRVEATYRSSSDTTLYLVTAPLAVWQLLPDHDGCQFISLITGGSLRSNGSRAVVRQQSREDMISTCLAREDAIRAKVPVDDETQLNETIPPPPPPYSQRNILLLD